MFFGRQEELKEIKDAYNSNQFESILTYRRRRVGKTMLIDQTIEGSNQLIIRYECKKTTPYSNLTLLSKLVLESFDEHISNYVFDDYSCLFYTLK